jgi:hypothetical protein
MTNGDGRGRIIAEIESRLRGRTIGIRSTSPCAGSFKGLNRVDEIRNYDCRATIVTSRLEVLIQPLLGM